MATDVLLIKPPVLMSTIILRLDPEMVILHPSGGDLRSDGSTSSAYLGLLSNGAWSFKGEMITPGVRPYKIDEDGTAFYNTFSYIYAIALTFKDPSSGNNFVFGHKGEPSPSIPSIGKDGEPDPYLTDLTDSWQDDGFNIIIADNWSDIKNTGAHFEFRTHVEKTLTASDLANYLFLGTLGITAVTFLIRGEWKCKWHWADPERGIRMGFKCESP